MPAKDYNVELMRQVHDSIQKKPGSHRQAVWSETRTKNFAAFERITLGAMSRNYVKIECPTAACVAGWAVQLSGGHMVVHESDVEAAIELGNKTIVASGCVGKSGKFNDVSTEGQNMLGLSWEEANDLFNGGHTRGYVLKQLERMIRQGEAYQEAKAARAEERRKKAEAKADAKIRAEAPSGPRVEYTAAEEVAEKQTEVVRG